MVKNEHGRTINLIKKNFEIANFLRHKGKNVQLWLEPNTKLDKQLKYADKKSIRYAIILGENELKAGEITLKDLVTQNQKTLSINDFFTSLA